MPFCFVDFEITVNENRNRGERERERERGRKRKRERPGNPQWIKGYDMESMGDLMGK